ncbi:MAG TPA: hypothetical protein VGB73_06790 [Pyrinomonadaceae bacterium]
MGRIILCCAFCLLSASIASAQQAKSKSFHTEGVFSNIKVGPGGDYSGMQIYLTDSDGQFYAAVTIAEGVLLAPVLVKVQARVEERKIEFVLGEGNDSRKFTGTVTAAGLTLTENGQRRLLKRKCYD